MMRIADETFTAPCGLEAAWNYLSSVERWPVWARHIRAVELTPAGPLAADSRGVIHSHNGGEIHFVMTEFDLHRHWKWVGPFLGARIHYDHLFEAVSPKETRIRFTLDAQGWTALPVGLLLGGLYRRNLGRAIPLLVRELERAGFRSR